MSDENDVSNDDSPLRSVGAALSGWARRVGQFVADVSGKTTIPEPLREPIATARALRLTGDRETPRQLLRDTLKDQPNQPHLLLALGLTSLHDLLLEGGSLGTLTDLAERLDEKELGAGPTHLLAGAVTLWHGELDTALDELRRARSGLDRLPTEDEHEARLLLHMVTGLAHARRGDQDRALRDLYMARVRLPREAHSPLHGWILEHGVRLLLASGRAQDAQSWIHDLRDAGSEAMPPLAVRRLLAETLAARDDRAGAHALVETLPEDDASTGTRVRVGLIVGLPGNSPHALCALALAHLQRDAHDPLRLRLWALSELSAIGKGGHDAEATADGGRGRELLDALVAAYEAAPPGVRRRYLQELAHVALRLDSFPDRLLTLIDACLAEDPATAFEELRLARARHRVATGDAAMHEDFEPGPPPRFRARPEAREPLGPDATSPLRSTALREAVLASQRSLATGEYCLARDDVEAAQDHLVAALIEAPRSHRARTLLAGLARPPSLTRLEDLLTSATTRLAAIPAQVRGVALDGVQRALSQVIAARERLARPLTIAIMGEFSSGKSTFVNALLGEEVAPMGVLPTTTTINVFRRGPSGGARVHYRDGRIATLRPSEIRHVEIERTGPRMGDAAVVDTPGLNALDTFHERVAREFLDQADAVVWVFSATRGGAASEAGMLSSLREGGRQVLGILNKIDTLEETEQAELTEYLREQLGKVLIDVVPLCARDALAVRTDGEAGATDDLFASVESALERHFLRRARDLKRRLTARRLSEGLRLALNSLDNAIGALQEQAQAARQSANEQSADPHAILLRFADRVRADLEDLDDPLVREAMALGVLRSGKGLARPTIDPQDATYLESFLRDAAFAVLQRALAGVVREPDSGLVVEILDGQFLPWAQGYLDGELDAGFVVRALLEQGAAAALGEAAVRAKLRAALAPMASTWHAHAVGLEKAVERARARRQAFAESAPRAEAIRLRTAVRPALDALLSAARAIDS
jgi:GTPase SAR1 family protein